MVASIALLLVVSLGITAGYIEKDISKTMFGILMCITGIIQYGSPLIKMVNIFNIISMM